MNKMNSYRKIFLNFSNRNYEPRMKKKHEEKKKKKLWETKDKYTWERKIFPDLN